MNTVTTFMSSREQEEEVCRMTRSDASSVDARLVFFRPKLFDPVDVRRRRGRRPIRRVRRLTTVRNRSWAWKTGAKWQRSCSVAALGGECQCATQHSQRIGRVRFASSLYRRTSDHYQITVGAKMRARVNIDFDGPIAVTTGNFFDRTSAALAQRRSKQSQQAELCA